METKPRHVAVLEIGSTGIRLLVAEIYGTGGWKVLDRAGKPVALGRDVFTSGWVSRESFMECLSVLRNFREFLAGWGIADEDVHVIATSALRVARNRDVFVDRVRQETGFRLAIVEGIEENRLMYLAVRFALKSDFPLFWRANSMILEIGGGSTEIMLLRRGQMVAAHSLKLGTILIGQASRFGSAAVQGRYLNENIRNTSTQLSAELDLAYVRTFVIAGSDARIAAVNAGTEVNENCRVIPRETFIDFAKRIQAYTVEECMEKLQISFADAEGLIPGILVYKFLLEQTGAAQVVVPYVSIREGLLIDLAQGVDSSLQEEFYSQITASALNLGRKYHNDEAHSRHVAKLCMSLFDALVNEHGMGRRERMMLETAALLHDIGMFIKASGHQLHGQYIVANSEIFGLPHEELAIIANVIRYHRGEPPSSTDIDYLALQREERILVLKMASLLKVADALDRGHSQQIKEISVEKKTESVVLHTTGNRDLSLEHIGLEEKAGLFQEVFGFKVILS
ncbi:HD domain-containing protein [Leadbettera azotonutricia]|uniref:Exopolyphosphatase n=1 Tax=Leadbettera azotonutricia (strain ATCC BAA-888 / DSM 13862 / ZAS-9) TaxID=545695 RepID=F5YFE9_LEAAZ|nr:HD domain-containing protein [Leadbettera azotonutricia]AEF82656.1 exopolyphosphatase [Leadbettera azotonutricia ZAS-9]